MAKQKATNIPEKFEPGFIQTLDGRTSIAQEMRGRFRAMTDDLGGASQLSYAQRSLVERCLWLECWISIQEAALARGDDASFDVGRYTQASNSLQGIYSKLGLKRVAREVTMGDYLKRRQEAAQ